MPHCLCRPESIKPTKSEMSSSRHEQGHVLEAYCITARAQSLSEGAEFIEAKARG